VRPYSGGSLDSRSRHKTAAARKQRPFRRRENRSHRPFDGVGEPNETRRAVTSCQSDPLPSPERSCVCLFSPSARSASSATRVALQSRSRSLLRNGHRPVRKSCLSGLFPSARTDQDGPQWVKWGRQIRPWTDFAPSPGSASASNRASKAAIRNVRFTSTPAGCVGPSVWALQVPGGPVGGQAAQKSRAGATMRALRPELSAGDRGCLPPGGFWPWPALTFQNRSIAMSETLNGG
jgi:hypothetical protein